MRMNRSSVLGVLTSLAVAIALAPAGATAASVDAANPVAPVPGQFRSIDLGTLGGANSQANAVNDRIQVVGRSDTATGETHPFLWQDGRMIDLGLLGGFQGTASAINNRGQVVGSSDTPSGSQHAFLWQNGRMTDLGTLGGLISSAYDINDRGQVIGVSLTTDDGWHAFRWENGVMADLGAFDARGLNNLGTVVGTMGRAYEGEPILPVRWDRGRLTVLDNTPGFASDINDTGTVIGGVERDGEASRAVVWLRGVRSELASLGGETRASDINSLGVIVGFSSPAGGDAPHTVVWYKHSMLDLSTRGVPIGALIVAINNHGQLAGSVDGHATLFR